MNSQDRELRNMPAERVHVKHSDFVGEKGRGRSSKQGTPYHETEISRMLTKAFGEGT